MATVHGVGGEKQWHLVGSCCLNPPAMQSPGSIPGSGRSSGEDGYPLCYSYLENPMDTGPW